MKEHIASFTFSLLFTLLYNITLYHHIYVADCSTTDLNIIELIKYSIDHGYLLLIVNTLVVFLSTIKIPKYFEKCCFYFFLILVLVFCNTIYIQSFMLYKTSTNCNFFHIYFTHNFPFNIKDSLSFFGIFIAFIIYDSLLSKVDVFKKHRGIVLIIITIITLTALILDFLYPYSKEFEDRFNNSFNNPLAEEEIINNKICEVVGKLECKSHYRDFLFQYLYTRDLTLLILIISIVIMKYLIEDDKNIATVRLK